MICYALDAGNNMFLDNQGNISMVSKGAEVVQLVRSRLLFYLGECSWDTNAGVPYFQRILGKPAQLDETEAILKTEILQTTGVSVLLDFALEFDSSKRLVTITFEAETIYGEIVGATINDVRIN